MPDIKLIFMNNEKALQMNCSENMLVKDVLNNYFKLTNSNSNLERTQFIFKTLVLNKGNNLNKSLRDLGIRPGSSIRVIDTNGVICGGGPF